MRRLILISAYCTLLSVFSATVHAADSSTSTGAPAASTSAPATSTKTDNKKEDKGKKPAKPEDITKEGWTYADDDFVEVCLVFKKEKRKDDTWLDDFDGKVVGIKAESAYEHKTMSPVFGRVFQCFGTKFGEFVDLLKTHGDGIQGFCDYAKERNPKNLGYPVIHDDDEYELQDMKKDDDQAPLLEKRHAGRLIRDPGYPARRRPAPPRRNSRPLHHNIRKRAVHHNRKRVLTGDDFSFLEKRADNKTIPIIKQSPRLNETEFPKQDTSDLRWSEEFTLDTQIVSTAPPGDGIENGYLFDAKDGEGVHVYIVDSGLNLQHTAFTWKNERKELGWILAGPKMSKQKKDFRTGSETSVGGSEVVAKVIGRTSGLARKAWAYMVVPHDADGNTNPLLYLDALTSMYNQIMTGQSSAGVTGDKNAKRKNVICFSHRLYTAARLNEMYMWTEYKKMPQHRKAFIDAVTGVMDEILAELGKNQDVVMVTRTSGILLNQYNTKAGDPVVGWPARRAFNITNMVLVGGVDMQGRYIMYQPPDVYSYSRIIFAPAADIRVPFTARGNSQDYYSAKYSIRLAIGTVSGVLASMMSKYNENGVQARARLNAYAYPRVFGGGPVVWNGLRIPTCDTPPTTITAKLEKPEETKRPKLARRADDDDVIVAPDPGSQTDYIEGEKVDCAPLPIVAKLIPGLPDKNGKANTSVVFVYSTMKPEGFLRPPEMPSVIDDGIPPGVTFVETVTVPYNQYQREQGVPKPFAGQLPRGPITTVSTRPGPSGGLVKVVMVPPSRTPEPLARPTSGGSAATSVTDSHETVATPVPSGTTSQNLHLTTSMASLTTSTPASASSGTTSIQTQDKPPSSTSSPDAASSSSA
ncbi:hypothetical protein TWF696_000555 [Orbilia brochopaga]|uniref:Peptidase S8/S53 domain-containing protein n=1 Tax=Orbilia brochopaga TaxID=3140254 RepID=A0AAV9VHZ0_9PEZI